MIRTAKFARTYRFLFALIGWSALVLLWISAVVSRPTGSSALIALAETFRYFTVQSNLFVLVWLTAAILYWNKEHKPVILRPIFKGAFTVYITVTFSIFYIVLQPMSNPQGMDALINAIVHYVTPIAFIIDWLLFEQKRANPWRNSYYWLVYPLAYLVFALFHGRLTGDYIYPFLDPNTIGWNGLATWIAILMALFLGLGVLYIAINRFLGVDKEAFLEASVES